MHLYFLGYIYICISQTIKINKKVSTFICAADPLLWSTTAIPVLICMASFVLSWGQRYWKEERERKTNLIKALPFLIELMGNCGMELKR